MSHNNTIAPAATHTTPLWNVRTCMNTVRVPFCAAFSVAALRCWNSMNCIHAALPASAGRPSPPASIRFAMPCIQSECLSC